MFKARTRRRRIRRVSPKRAFSALIGLVALAVYLVFSPPEESATTIECPQSQYAPSQRLRVCSWNVHNYNVSNRRVNGVWRAYPKPESERDAVCAALKAIDADVVLLQEMGDKTYLEDLLARLRKAGVNYAFAAVAKFDSPSRLAILSKIAPRKVFDFSDTAFFFDGQNKYSPRGALGVEIRAANLQLYAFSVHLKSKVNAKKSDEKFTPFRHAELRAISARIRSVAKKGSKILVAGDFNDEPAKPLLRNAKTFELVEQADSRGLAYTYHWAKRELLFRYDFFLAANLRPPEISKAFVVSGTQNASDHRPIYVDIKLEELSAEK